MPEGFDITARLLQKYAESLQNLQLEDIQFHVSLRTDKFENLITDLENLSSLLRERLSELAEVGLKGVQEQIYIRALAAHLGNLEYAKAGGRTGHVPWTQSSRLVAGKSAFVNILKTVRSVRSSTSSALLDLRALDTIRLRNYARTESGLQPEEAHQIQIRERAGRSTKPVSSGGGVSEYDIVWRLFEFGSGQYADPETKRVTGHFKQPGGGGAWYRAGFPFNFNEGTAYRFGLTIGQPGSHFLFGNRETQENNARDVLAAKIAIFRHLSDLLEKMRQ